jgi:ATP-dependent DNA helicase PIF1
MLLQVGNGGDYTDNLVQVVERIEETKTDIVSLPLLTKNIWLTKQEAIAAIHPDGFQPTTMHNKAILATLNTKVDEWNAEVQKLNFNQMQELHSADYFDEVDDPKSILADMVSDDLLHKFTSTGVPHHNLQLKVDDICLVVRTISKADKLSTNTRVQITRISPYVIRVKTLGPRPTFHSIPRIRFKLKLPYGKSFTMTRTQFPLRLAYCMSVNKSQGQSLAQCLLDLTDPSFSHGHTYVALSRIHHVDTIHFFGSEENFQKNGDQVYPIVHNIVYDELRI